MIMVPALRPAMSPAMSNRASQTAINFDSLVSMLFAASEQGVWYDPSDMSTMYQDSAGTVPVTAVEQPVGRILDKSGRGNHASQATTTKRPIYSRRVNLLVDSTTLATQSITTQAAGYKIVFSGTGSVTLSGTATGVYGAGTNSITCTAGTLTLTVSGAVQDASFHLAIDLYLPYQGVNTATDYDADPAKFPAYLRFDGVDDALQTGNIDFTGTDKMTVWAGVTALDMGCTSGAVNQLLYSNAYNYNGFGLRTPSSSGIIIFVISGSIGIAEPNEGSLGAAPRSMVICGVGNQSAPLSQIRRDGVLRASSTTVQGASGGYGNRSMWMGSQSGTSRFFNGRLYSLIVRGAQSSLSQIEATEVHIKQKMRLP